MVSVPFFQRCYTYSHRGSWDALFILLPRVLRRALASVTLSARSRVTVHLLQITPDVFQVAIRAASTPTRVKPGTPP